MSLKENEQVKIEDVAETVAPKEETAVEQKNEDIVTNDEFGFTAEFKLDEYTTISGKEYRDMGKATQYNIKDFDIGNVINGYPELTIFENNDKDDKGEYVKNYQSVRLRIIDGDEEYVDLYANIPRRDTNGFVEKLNKGWKFMRGGFDLAFSFMRWVDETNVVTPTGEEINYINKINMDAICRKIDSMEWVKVKIVEGADEDYPSWIILDIKNL